MGDQFEKFIISNRDGFDENGPDDKLWEKIEKKLPEQNDTKMHILWKVAAILFLASTILLLLDRGQSESETPNGLLTEFVEAESYYSSMILEKREILKEEADRELTKQFFDDLENLDQSYKELKSTLDSELLDQKIINAMVKNLQMQLDILNRQVEIIEESKGLKNKKDENYEI